MTPKYYRVAIAAVALLFGSASHLMAQDKYPNRPVTLVVPYNAGGGLDRLARNLAPILQEQTGQPFVVDNRPGASGEIGVRHVMESPADGYTILLNNNTMITNAALQERNIDFGTDMIAVIPTNSVPLGIAVHPSIPAKSIPELVDYIKAQSGVVTYSSCGTGTVMHLAGELFKQVAKVNMEHVSYPGCGPAMTDGLGGHVPILFNTLSNILPQAQGGALRLLAVTGPIEVTGVENEVSVIYKLPGYEKVRGEIFGGIFVSPKTPDDMVAQIYKIFDAALADPRAKSYIDKTMQLTPKMTTPEFTAFANEELAAWKDVVQKAGLQQKN